MRPDIAGALDIFRTASEYVRVAGYHKEIEWQREASPERFTERDLLCESAWVVLCSGFREAVVRRVFDHVSLCFCDWESASAIVSAGPICKIAARASFRNESKLEALAGIARFVHDRGFSEYRNAILCDPITELRRLPFIGSVTVWHLAKNLGFNAAKPDRHLVRISSGLGFRNVGDFCAAIAEVSGEETKVIDLIVWRYLADKGGLLRRHA